MARFTRPGLVFIGSLTALVGAQLWQRRRLGATARRVQYEAGLAITVIRIAHEIRGLLSVEAIMRTTVGEVARALDAHHILLRIEGAAGGPSLIESYRQGAENRDASPDPTLLEDLETCDAALAERGSTSYMRDARSAGSDGSQTRRARPLIAVPLIYTDRSTGSLLVRTDDPTRIWLESELQALLAVAHQTVLSIEQARLFARTELLSQMDSLTGCYNRRAFDDRLDSEVTVAMNVGRTVSLIMLDADHFKRINDTHGHDAGDSVLRFLGDVLRDVVGSAGVVARFGGEEFMAILPGVEAESAAALADKLRERVEGATVPSVSERITASFGVAAFPLHASSPEELVRVADSALYEAKDSGRNRVCVSRRIRE